jgi:hypothetical protein
MKPTGILLSTPNYRKQKRPFALGDGLRRKEGVFFVLLRLELKPVP